MVRLAAAYLAVEAREIRAKPFLGNAAGAWKGTAPLRLVAIH